MQNNIGFGIPAEYDYINTYNANFSPSTVHVKNTALQRFFRRYLLQTATSVFNWQLPETWNRDYFLYVLYCWGFIGVVNRPGSEKNVQCSSFNRIGEVFLTWLTFTLI